MNDQQLIETLYPEPRSLTDADRATMRARLFGSTDRIPQRTLPGGHGSGDETPDVPVDDVELTDDADSDDRANRRRMMVVAVVLAIAGLAGVWAAADRNADETTAPAQPSATTASGDPTNTAAAAQQRSRPTAFPLLDELPVGLSATARVTQAGDGSGNPQTVALIGRRLDGVLTDAVAIAVQSEPADIVPTQGREPIDAVIMGQPALVHDESYAELTVITVTWGSGPYFIAQGKNPLALLNTADPGDIEGKPSTGGDGPPSVTIGTLSDDFEVIVAPHPLTNTSGMSATLLVGDADGSNYAVTVSTMNPLISLAMTSNAALRSIRINGQPGWTPDSPTAKPDIIWQVNESTSAYLSVSGDSTPADALDLAKRLTFVDFDTWATRYSLDTANDT